MMETEHREDAMMRDAQFQKKEKRLLMELRQRDEEIAKLKAQHENIRRMAEGFEKHEHRQMIAKLEESLSMDERAINEFKWTLRDLESKEVVSA